MTNFILAISLEPISLIISILTPVILFFWFYYSQKQIHSKNYYKEISGVYAGFTVPVSVIPEPKTINAGIIMNIRDVDNKGFFRGDFNFGETILTIKNDVPINIPLSVGIHTFQGKMNYKLYIDKSRHPFKPKQNRIYSGKLYIVSRLDFSFESYKIEDYLNAEYDIVHYREMQTLKFTLNRIYKKGSQALPKSFKLYKSVGFPFEPLKGVKDIVFRGNPGVGG